MNYSLFSAPRCSTGQTSAYERFWYLMIKPGRTFASVIRQLLPRFCARNRASTRASNDSHLQLANFYFDDSGNFVIRFQLTAATACGKFSLAQLNKPENHIIIEFLQRHRHTHTLRSMVDVALESVATASDN
jgi:hypothetical protein